jgi:hypothetical protein
MLHQKMYVLNHIAYECPNKNGCHITCALFFTDARPYKLRIEDILFQYGFKN